MKFGNLTGVVFLPSVYTYAEQGDKHQGKECQSPIGNGFRDVNSLRIEGHNDLVFTSRNLDGSKHIIGSCILRLLSINRASPARIVDFTQDNDSSLLARYLI